MGISSFLSTELLLSVVDLVLGSVVVDSDDVLMLEVDRLVGLVTPVLTEPFRDMLFVTELREALELDLLKFSLELVGCLFPILEIVAAVPLVFEFVTLRAFLTFSVDL